ncbi:hypothetical protein DUZ99_00020 [Xylanibacillus composti]|uniref:Uncharacterized protein n=1 Tax=Xylanibacillus composti TaxID=1572762 RepID=A0A8J4M170_9BACL|nr:hypothetical protein [Xylanibacillus composti]MDT9723400.1 hypothetical protein [Xylanibacillus composti]GIQ68565.1 hypothetical protein XYCOK13_13890 [Xylanibacillus composti]
MHVFDDFRPIYISFIFILIILLISIILYKNRLGMINGFVITSISLIILIASIYMTNLAGVLTDELSMSGDAVSFYMFIMVALLSIINVVAYFYKKR